MDDLAAFNVRNAVHNPRRRVLKLLLSLLLTAWFSAFMLPRVTAEDAFVRGILFYSPSCGHCHYVFTEILPPLVEKYGNQLEIIAISTAHVDGQKLYQAAIQHFDIPVPRQGVPTLIVGEHVLVGSQEIPQEFPTLIDTLLATGGADWPEIPGLAEALTAVAGAPPAAEEAPATGTETATIATTPVPETMPMPLQSDSPSSTMGNDAGERSVTAQELADLSAVPAMSVSERFQRDPSGNSMAIVVLLGMAIAALFSVAQLQKAARTPGRSQQAAAWQFRLIPLLLLAGLIISGYMAWIETTQNTAVCGPVGDCNAVQQSEYARLFGLFPIGVVGIVGYMALGFAWALSWWGHGQWRLWARLLLTTMALGGTLFSIYLTFLEPFVIGATCMWCISSALSITLVLLLSSKAGGDALSERLTAVKQSPLRTDLRRKTGSGS